MPVTAREAGEFTPSYHLGLSSHLLSPLLAAHTECQAWPQWNKKVNRDSGTWRASIQKCWEETKIHFYLKERRGCGGLLKKRKITLMICIFIIEKVHPIKENEDSFEYSKEVKITKPLFHESNTILGIF